MDDAATLYAKNPALFAPVVDDGQFEPISLHGELLERANFVDARFADLWPVLELRTPTIPWANNRLSGRDAFRYEDTGKEGFSAD